jgi:glucose/arabinose dehydrogenase
MRHVALAMLMAACGGGGEKPDGQTGVQDAPGSTADAPPLAACTPVNGTNVKVRKVTQITGSSALLVTAPPNDGRLFVVTQDGRIMIVENEQVKPTPFLDLSDTNLTSDVPQGERGLLGLAFSPNYATDRAFYVFYTTITNQRVGNNIVARYHASATDPYKADPTGEIILSIPDFATNHNGGMIQFGKDGYLYIGTGDGGDGNDPHRNAQALTRGGQVEPLLGKILRIDVNTTSGMKNYGIPADNPFLTSDAPEAFVIGVRNPWRWSFDRETGDLWIGDVGQGTIEEVDVLKAGEISGKNLGWSRYEGANCFSANYPACDATGITMPQFTKNHSPDGWLAIIGGEVYRGTCFPDLVGTYFVTDNTKHALTTLELEANGSVTATVLPTPTGGWPAGPSSIHSDARGELYMTTTNGTIYQIEAGP